MDSDDNDDSNSNEIQKLVSQCKNLNLVLCRKNSLRNILNQLTVCNNLVSLSKNSCEFSAKVLNVTCKVVCDSVDVHSQAIQTLIVSISNRSENFTLEPDHWQVHIGFNDVIQGTWGFQSALGPGATETFRVPLTSKTFHVIFQMKVSVSFNFSVSFDSVSYTKSFELQEYMVDLLHCLDPEKNIADLGLHQMPLNIPLISEELHETTEKFPPVEKFFLRLGPSLREKFVKDVLLHHSMHRGFLHNLEEMEKKTTFSIFFLGVKIDVDLPSNSDDDIITISCKNPVVLCALKAAILRRFVSIEGILVEPLSDKSRENLTSLELNLDSTFIHDDDEGAIEVGGEELMEFYLDLREVTESVLFGLVYTIE